MSHFFNIGSLDFFPSASSSDALSFFIGLPSKDETVLADWLTYYIQTSPFVKPFVQSIFQLVFHQACVSTIAFTPDSERQLYAESPKSQANRDAFPIL
jgi:hypothetical protein